MGMSIASELNQLLAQKAAFYGEHFKAIESLEQLPQEAISLNSVLSQAHYPALLQQFALSYQAKVSTTCATKPEIDARALHSMWSQWFFGLQLPPLLLWLFASQPGSALNRAIAAAACSGNWYLEPFDNGRAETFYLLLDADVSHPAPAGQLASWESLLDQLLIPIVERLAELGPVPSKLHFSHQAYIVHWYLGELSLPVSWRQQLIREMFEQAELQPRTYVTPIAHPFWRKLRLKQQQSPRIACCLRHKLPCTQMCADCPLDKDGRKGKGQKACG
ncbi:siderophore-iron reductase FhuF [Shewanella algae]|uniref:siderophore-iron reductase FhuF n=1 Tax=Shewanella algae TaxID=38313 RepID=UPI00313D33BA